MPSFIIRVIRPVERTAEFEYIKEFFRFIGFLVTDYAVDDTNAGNWLNALVPDEKSNCIEIVMNSEKDPYLDRCKQLGIKRLYCKANFNADMMCAVVEKQPSALVPQQNGITNKQILRRHLLYELIRSIWNDESARNEIQQIADIYLNQSGGELFYFLQAKRNLRVLVMGEVLKERTAQVTNISLLPYIKSCVTSLWQAYRKLSTVEGLHAKYTRINIANKLYEITAKLYDTERPRIAELCSPPEIPVLIQELEDILEQEPKLVSAHLLLANICSAFAWKSDAEDLCYRRLWNTISRGSRDYAFIWYRNAYFYEKRKKDLGKALEYYRYAVQLNQDCYQAWFKLGYYAAAEKRYDQAEYFLKQMISSIFRGRSTDPDENGAYTNWLALSTKQNQYIYKAYMLLAKIALNRNQENAIRAYIGRACMAATRFEEATVVRQVSDYRNDSGYEMQFQAFEQYHRYSTPVWAMWQVLSPWTENVVQDPFVRDIVRERLARWTVE